MRTSSIYDDQQLLCLLQTGDREAFTQIYHRHSKSLFLKIYHLVKIQEVAEEILQDIFVLIWEKRETIIIQQSFNAYIQRVATNRTTDFFRKLQRDRKAFERIKDISSSSYSHIEEKLFTDETASIFREAIEALPPQRRQVFCLCKMEGKSYGEVSHLLGISTSTINDHIVKATRFVRERLLANKDVATLGCMWYMLSTSQL